METSFNRLQLKALLLDAITFHKFGQHLAPNWKQAKNRLCEQAGQKTNIKNIDFIRLIGLIYKDNNLQSEFDELIDKKGMTNEVYN